MSELKDREKRLVALGAAIASNCVPCIENYIPEARKAGFSESQIREALQIADKVRQVPARMVLRTALARVEGDRSGLTETDAAGCGCAESSPRGGSGCAG